MQTLDYQIPHTPNGNHVVGGGYAIVSCTLSMVSVLVLLTVASLLCFDPTGGYSWQHAYFIACLPAGVILLFAWGTTLILTRRHPLIRPVTILSMIFNVGATFALVLAYFS